MSMTNVRFAIPLTLLGSLIALPAMADTTFFSTGDPDGKIATASRPDTAGKFEIESADDFILTHSTSITDATFTGLLSGGATVSDIGEVVVEIYRVFPNDSDITRTSGPPTFSTSQVPTRVNSPSDVALDSRDSTSGLTFTTNDLGSFVALNSVQPGGINPKPGQTTGGDGGVRGEEVEFNITFTTPFALPADHYFFVPQVEVTTADGNFLWLSAPKPITGGTGPFVGDLQSWTRDAALDPDWLRVGTDIVGAGTFNAAFSLSGSVIPEPSTWAMMLIGFAGLGYAGWRRARQVSLVSG
jgi:PEP-CTERM motif-containing protein